MAHRLSRRGLIAGVAGSSAGGLATGVMQARAGTYPDRPIRIVVGFAPGGGADLVARIIAEGLSARVGQQVVVENMTGASTAIALNYIAHAAPDGYLLAYATADGTSILSAVNPKLQYNVAIDFTYLSRVVQLDYVLVANGRLPFRSLQELIAYGRSHPGKIRYGSIGVGSSTHLAMLLLGQQAGVSMTDVPYSGGEDVLTDLLSGIIDVALLTTANIGQYENTTQIRLLAVTSSTRDPALPDVPTMTECGYSGATMTAWQGILAPKGLPGTVANVLIDAIRASMDEAVISTRIRKLGFRPSLLTGTAFQHAVVSEIALWRAVARRANLSFQ
jgi:tripartite-type tricarboxylate transporter receptor subunit TctC